MNQIKSRHPRLCTARSSRTKQPCKRWALKGHRRRQLERQLSVGKEWRNELDLVFTNSLGKGLEARTFIRCFKKVLRESGLRDLRFHDLRHGFASMLLSEGVNVKIVQELLGHSSVLVTLDTYAHFSADLQNDAVSRLDTLLGTN